MAVTEDAPIRLTGQPSDLTFDAVCRQHHAPLVSLLARIVGDRAQAEDVVSEAFNRLMMRPAIFRPDGTLEGWLYRTALNLALDILRSQARRRRYEHGAAVERIRLGKTPDPLSELLRKEQERAVRDALASLRRRHATALWLRYSGFAYREVAAVLRMPPASVPVLLARALVQFKKKYLGMYGGLP